jgi:hypothetical protein
MTRTQSGTKHKGMVSDALKRAAVLFGVGESVYASPSAWLPAVDDYNKSWRDHPHKAATRCLRSSSPMVASPLARKAYGTWLDEDRHRRVR